MKENTPNIQIKAKTMLVPGETTPQSNALSMNKQALLKKLKQTRITSLKSQGVIKERNANKIIPLSSTQKRLWFLEKLTPGLPTYNMPMAYRIKGNFDVTILKRCLNEIIKRHESLRTCFIDVDGVPEQKVYHDVKFDLPSIDIRHISEEERELEIKKITNQEIKKIFDLTKAPLMRVQMVQCSDDEYIFVAVVHHIISDSWSLGVFFTELVQRYTHYARDIPFELPPLPIQYADFSFYQEKYHKSKEAQNDLKFWQNHLSGKLPILKLPLDRPRPAVSSNKGGVVRFECPVDLTVRVKKFCSENRVSLFMYLFTVFNILLKRYSGQDDIVVGTPIAGRNKSEFKDLIGYFANTLALRTDMANNPTFLQLLEKVRKTSLDAFNHQNIAMEDLIEELAPERNMSHSPLFQVMLALQNTPMTKETLSGLCICPMDIDLGTSRFDMWLSFHDSVDSENILSGMWEYNRDIFDEKTIQQMVKHFVRLLTEALEHPDRSINEMELLSKNEIHYQVVELNDSLQKYLPYHRLDSLFSRQAKKNPDRIALIFENQKLSYSEFNERSSQLANKLRELGIKTNDVVGVCMDRSIEMVISLMGIVKAGGAYLPLDPTYPKKRLAFMMKDSQIKVVLTQQHLVDHLPTLSMIVLDDSNIVSELKTYSTEVDQIDKKESDLAYIIYTSGSTGNPKGVMIDHQAVCNRLLWMQERYQLTEDDVVLQKTPYSFDVSVWEFFWPFVAGASLVVAKPEGHKEPEYLRDVIREQKITTMHFVPPMLSVFLETIETIETGGNSEISLTDAVEACSSLKRVICSGEALPLKIIQQFHKVVKDCELHNLYGPTEAAIDVTHWECQRGSDLDYVPIGHPVANTQLYILDDNLRPLPYGVSGELYIGGVQVAKGYLKRDDLNQQKFISDPFSSDPQGRLFKTGDLVRYREDGAIEFLGRKDNQIKIRGFRIEIGEIENEISQFPLVKDVSVIAVDDNINSNNKMLVAYVVPQLDDTAHSSVSIYEQASLAVWQAHFDDYYRPEYSFEGHKFNYLVYRGEKDKWQQNSSSSSSRFDYIASLFAKDNLGKQKIIEIGPGFGELLFRLAPDCDRYYALDISQSVVVNLGAKIKKSTLLKVKVKDNVYLAGTAAHELDSVFADDNKDNSNAFDILVINNVVKYFPSLSYLTNVIKKAINVMGDEGKIFIGDVINYNHQDDNSLTGRELLINPEFFKQLKNNLDFIHQVDIELLADEDTANNHFRYDVILHLGSSQSSSHSNLQPGSQSNSHELNNDKIWSNNPLLKNIEDNLVPRLNDYLKEKLPEFMVPSLITVLPNLPLSLNGKVERKKLPLSFDIVGRQEEEVILPKTMREKKLATIWEKVLTLEKVGINQNFFHIGGNSISSIQVISRAVKEGINFSPKQLFQYQTISELLRMLDQERQEGINDNDNQINQSNQDNQKSVSDSTELLMNQEQQEQIEDVYHVSPFQEYQLAYMVNRGVRGLSLLWQLLPFRFPFSEDAFAKTWEILIARHKALRTAFRWEDVQGFNRPVQVVYKKVASPFKCIDLRHLTLEDYNKEIDRYIEQSFDRGFDLQEAPQLIVTVFRKDDNYSQIFWSFNYMLHDGWSTSYLVGEFVNIYESIVTGKQPELSQVRPFKDYINWLDSRDTNASKSFFKNMLNGVIVPTPLIECAPDNKKEESIRYTKKYNQYSEDITSRLDDLINKHGLTLAALIHAGWALCMSKYTQLDDVLFGSICSGRPSSMVGVENMIGHFNNLLPFKVTVEKGQSLISWLKKVHADHVELQEHQYTSLLEIKEWCGYSLDENMFDSYVVLENFPTPDNIKSQKDTHELVPAIARVNIPLRLEIFPRDRLLLSLTHDHSVYSEASVNLMLDDLRQVLSNLANNPGVLVGDLFGKHC